LAFDQGTHGIQIGTEFLFWTHKVMALRVPGLGLQQSQKKRKEK
jgi:hypothetical protein